MSEKVLLDESGKHIVLLGNKAIVRGALESGVQFAATYPGTPSSEIGDTFAKISKDTGIYFEYSTNEKVALEAAAGAAFSGLRAMVSFKHFGFNVAVDTIAPVAYVGVDGGLVIVFTEDPNCWSSTQTEQDSRYLTRMVNAPVLEPSNAQECKDFVKLAYELSEKYRSPIFIRLTTRVSHTRSEVELGKIVKGKKKANFEKSYEKYNTFPPKILGMHGALVEKMANIKEEFESYDINKVMNADSNEHIGIVTFGISYNYVMDALNDLGLKLPVLKLATTYPLPEKTVGEFLKNLKSVIVVEELDPVLERDIEIVAKRVNPKLKICGKKYFPVVGEFKPDVVLKGIAEAVGKKLDVDYDKHMQNYSKLEMARRFPVMCPGCPHRATFYTVKKAAGDDTIFGGEIGCSLLGAFPPFETEDYTLAMGSSQGISHGIKKANIITGGKQKVVSFLGDSSFFHAGIPAMINAVINKSNILVVILDNRITAMTGLQPHPGTGRNAVGDETIALKIEDIATAVGVENVKVIDPYNIKELEATVKEFLKNDTVSVIVAKRPCYLMESRMKRKKGIKLPVFEVAEKLDEKESEELHKYACPAYYIDEKGEMEIDPVMCWGCGSCVQFVEKGKIQVKKE